MDVQKSIYVCYFVADVIDVVKDSVEVGAEEDPTLYVSEKTGRGPLSVNWLEEYTSVSCHFLIWYWLMMWF